jgi:hypothetical protein
MAVYTTDAPDAPDNRAYLREHLSLCFRGRRGRFRTKRREHRL